MKRFRAALLFALAMPGATLAEGHGWARETGPGYRLSDIPPEFAFRSAVGMGDTLITLWERAPFVDPEERDFLGNPLQVRRSFIRCVEERGADGLFRMQYCETQ